MALKNILKLMKTDSESVVARLDKFLMKFPDESSEDRGHGMNSPSSIGYCIRSNYYVRKGMAHKAAVVLPRMQRIFDNGHYVHDRLQTYLEKMGLLKLREVPVYNEELQIMGHSDGLIALSPLQLAILEIKSINDNGFSKLVEAKSEHVAQAHVYMYCVEELRKKVHDKKIDNKSLIKKYRMIMEGFVVDGSRFTKEEKIKFKLDYLVKVLDLLETIQKPINTVVLLYENKNNQELKSYEVRWDDKLIADIIAGYKTINALVEANQMPDRPQGATGRTSPMCRNCNFIDTCY